MLVTRQLMVSFDFHGDKNYYGSQWVPSTVWFTLVLSMFLSFSVELYPPGRVHQAWEKWAGLCSGRRGQWEHTKSERYLLWGCGWAGWSSQSGWHPFGGM